MNPESKPVQERPRRRQEERTLETRRRVLEATVKCLYRLGYSAVTFAMVAEEAGVSRGIISYHFTSKADLMVAVRNLVQLQEQQLNSNILARIGVEAYLRELPRHVMHGMRREPAIAVNEILLAARADTDLSSKLRIEEKHIEDHAVQQLRLLYADAGVTPPVNLPVRMRVAVAAFRGLAILELVQGDDAEIEDCIAHLMEMLDPPSLIDTAPQIAAQTTK